MTGAMNPLNLNSPEPPVGMSDEEEIRRAARDISDSNPLGEEILVDFKDELKELGVDVGL